MTCWSRFAAAANNASSEIPGTARLDEEVEHLLVSGLFFEAAPTAQIFHQLRKLASA